jgi:hypothetical protein
MREKQNHRNREQKMDRAEGNVKCQESEDPQYEQQGRDFSQHHCLLAEFPRQTWRPQPTEKINGEE